MKKMRVVVSIFAVCMLFAGVALAGDARMPAIKVGAANLIELQRTDPGWEGTWYWYDGNLYNATNLTGVTALGLLEAYKDTKNKAFLTASKNAAAFLMEHLGVGATGVKHHVRWTAPDVIFVHYLAKATGNAVYAARATLEWNNIKSTYPTAGDLDARFRLTSRASTWDIAFFMEAAYLSGDYVWANDAAVILADIADTFYYNESNGWYALNVAASIRALTSCGYTFAYQTGIIQLVNDLISLCGPDGVDGYVQDTAYAVLAFRAVGGPANGYANELARWLATQQAPGGGWFEGGLEYPEIDGEAVRALASTIGANSTFKLKLGLKPASLWRKALGDAAHPFNED